MGNYERPLVADNHRLYSTAAVWSDLGTCRLKADSHGLNAVQINYCSGTEVQSKNISILPEHQHMSRSQRKTPKFGITTCRSEKEDKKLWHQRSRARERTSMTAASPETLMGYLPLLENQVSNVWAMGKDGHTYCPSKEQETMADLVASRLGKNPEEIASLKQRLLHKWMAK